MIITCHDEQVIIYVDTADDVDMYYPSVIRILLGLSISSNGSSAPFYTHNTMNVRGVTH
jgi:hypothetical protein